MVGILLLYSSAVGKELKHFPPDLEKAIPLKVKSLLQYCDKMAPHYLAVGHLLGLSDTVHCLIPGNDELQSKMIRILHEWIETGHAKWATLVQGIEKHIPRLRGVASEIRKDLREEKEKQDKCECAPCLSSRM